MAGRLPHPLFLRPQMELCHLRGTGHRAGGRTGNFAAGTQRLLPPTVAEREAAGCRVVLVAHSEERVEGVLPGTVRPVAALVLEDPIRPDAGRPWPFSPGRTYN